MFATPDRLFDLAARATKLIFLFMHRERCEPPRTEDHLVLAQLIAYEYPILQARRSMTAQPSAARRNRRVNHGLR
jgi:hypothetical protein